MKLFVGLDVSLERTAICVISEHGKIVKEAQVASEPEALTRWFREPRNSSSWWHRPGAQSTNPTTLVMNEGQPGGGSQSASAIVGRKLALAKCRNMWLAEKKLS